MPVVSPSALSPWLVALWSLSGSRCVEGRFSVCPSPMRSFRPVWTRSSCSPPSSPRRLSLVLWKKGDPLWGKGPYLSNWYISPVMASLDVRCLSVEPSAHPAAYLRAVRALLGGLRSGSAFCLLSPNLDFLWRLLVRAWLLACRVRDSDVVVMREVVDELYEFLPTA